MSIAERLMASSVRTRLSFLVVVLLACGIAVLTIGLWVGLGQWRDALLLNERNEIARQSLAAAKHVLIERGRSNVVLRASAPVDPEHLTIIHQQRAWTDAAIAAALRAAADQFPAETQSIASALVQIEALRQEIDRAAKQTLAKGDVQLAERWIAAANVLIADLETLLLRATAIEQADYTHARFADLRRDTLRFRNAVGLESLILSGAFSAGQTIGPDELREALLLRGASMQLWQQIDQEAAYFKDTHLERALDRVRQKYFITLRPMHDEMIAAAQQGRRPALALDAYLDISGIADDSLLEMVENADRLATEHATQHLRHAQMLLGATLAGLLLLSTLGWLTHRVLQQDLINPLRAILTRIHRLSGAGEAIAVTDPSDLHNIDRALDLLEQSLLELRALHHTTDQALTQLAASEQRFRQLFEKNRSVMLLIDPQSGAIVDANQAATNFYGIERQRLLAMSIDEINTLSSKEIHRERERALREECGYFNFRHRLANGEVRDVEVYSSPLELDGRSLLLSIVHDISARRQAEAELLAHQQHLEEKVAQRTAELAEARDAACAANRAKSVFLANMSHELRTPLNAILGFAQIMARSTRLPADQRRHLEAIDRSGRHLLTLINDVLEISRIEAGRLSAQLETLDLYALLAGLIEALQPRARGQGLDLRLEQAANLPRYIVSDPVKLRQILLNLLSNAVKYTPAGEVILYACLTECQGDQGVLDLAVNDTGVGIAADEQVHLFEPFYQTESGIRRGEGAGLGLAISSEYARLLGGELTVKSAPGTGSTFRLRLPAMLADAPPPESTSHGRVLRLATDQPTRRLLVAEDEPISQQVIELMLSEVGFEVRLAGDGQQAVKLFSAWRPDAVLMDMRMPVMDGLAATRAIRALPEGQNVPIFALTAEAFEEERQRMFEAGCCVVITKPVDEERLFALLESHLGVRFEREADRIGEASDDDAALLAEQLQTALNDPYAVPSGLTLRQMLAAAIALDGGALQAQIDPLAAKHPELAATLRRLIAGYRYEILQHQLQVAIDQLDSTSS